MCSTMRHSTCRWLVGPILALVVLGGGVTTLAVFAQPPGTWAPPASTAPSPGTGGLAAPGPGSMPGPSPSPGLPTTRAGVPTIQVQGDLLRYQRNVPGDAKPILIDADEIFTWEEDGKVALVLRGQ